MNVANPKLRLKEKNNMSLKNLIEQQEKMVWDALKVCDRDAYLEYVAEDAVMVCGGFCCYGIDYADIVKDFDCAYYEIMNFEVVAEESSIVQVHYVVETKVSKEENQDLAGKFHVTSTWKKSDDQWKMVFNMDSRIFEP